MAVLAFPWLAVSSITPFTLASISLPALLPLLFSSLYFHSLSVHSLFQLSTFWKCHIGLPLRGKATTQLHALLSVHELTKRCLWVNHWQTLKEKMQLVTDHNLHLLFAQRFVDWWASSKVCILCNYSQLIDLGKWNLNYVVGSWFYLIKL